MSRRVTKWLRLGFSACGIVLLSACAGVHSDASAPPAPGVSPSPQGVFTVESPLRVVAAKDQAWILTHESDGASLSRIGVTGPSTNVRRVPGQGFQMTPYRDGVVVASVACADSACRETVVSSLVLDGQGTTVSALEFAREPGSPERSDAVQLIGVQENTVWLRTAPEVIAYDPQTGRIVDRAPSPNGISCLFEDGLYTLLSLDKQFPPRGLLDGSTIDDAYEVAIHRLVDGEWAQLSGTRRTLTELQLGTAECVAGAVRTGPADSPSVAWSPASGWADVEPLPGRRDGRPPVPAEGPVVADGQQNQRFFLESDGVLRRVFGTRGAAMRAETLDAPAEVFKRDPNGPPPALLFDQSPTIVAGCVLSLLDTSKAAQCYIDTP